MWKVKADFLVEVISKSTPESESGKDGSEPLQGDSCPGLGQAQGPAQRPAQTPSDVGVEGRLCWGHLGTQEHGDGGYIWHQEDVPTSLPS